MKNFILKMLLILVVVLSFASFVNADDLRQEFHEGDNFILIYKDYKTNVEFTTVITLSNEKNYEFVFEGIVHGKTARESFRVHGLLETFFVNEGKLPLKIIGLTVAGKRILRPQSLGLKKTGDSFVREYNFSYAEIRPLKNFFHCY